MKQIAIWSMLAALLLLTGAALAQSSESYNLEWYTVSGGGQTVSSERFIIHGTIEGGASGPPYASSDHYVVGGGYWPGAVPMAPYRVYLPVLWRSW